MSGGRQKIAIPWWEPTYAHNNWSGHTGSLYRDTQNPVLTPIHTIKTWGSFAAPRATAGIARPIIVRKDTKA